MSKTLKVSVPDGLLEEAARERIKSLEGKVRRLEKKVRDLEAEATRAASKRDAVRRCYEAVRDVASEFGWMDYE